MSFKTIKLLAIAILAFVSIGSARQTADETVITLNAIAGLKFNISRFIVKPGSRVKIIYTNNDDMSHNLLITTPGKRLAVVNAALQLEEKGPDMNFIPRSPDVLWSVAVISPNQTKTLTFTAPTTEGVYPYVCTYPGHGFTMFGAMYVSSSGKMPELKTDENLPPAIRKEAEASATMNMAHAGQQIKDPAAHPYSLTPPFMYRGFMDDAGPAAIAVCLPQDIAYCWDAGACRLRYAWAGGFVDASQLWKGHADAVLKVLGTVFYRDNTSYPIRLGGVDAIPVTKFKGYELKDRYPEFHYTLDGADVYELIKPLADGNGIVRQFRVIGNSKTVWLIANPGNESTYYGASTGKWENGQLKLSAEQAQSFSVTITSYQLIYNTKRKKKI